MIYFDTSYIAKCYLNEPYAEVVRQCAMQAEGLACSQLGRVEFWSVLNRHIREGRLAAHRARSAATFPPKADFTRASIPS